MLVSEIVRELTTMPHQPTAALPRNRIGIYGLIDHEGRLSYIGSTASPAENFRKRIHQRHRTGSENHSHYFSKIYNTGRMWRDPVMQKDHGDARISKKLRSAFIAEYCRAVWVALEGTKKEIVKIESAVITSVPEDCRRWNSNTALRYPEPTRLVDDIIDMLRFDEAERAAINRQASLFLSMHTSALPHR